MIGFDFSIVLANRLGLIIGGFEGIPHHIIHRTAIPGAFERPSSGISMRCFCRQGHEIIKAGGAGFKGLSMLAWDSLRHAPKQKIL